MDDKISQKIAKKYCCKKCDYVTSNKNDYEKHLLTGKHQMDDKWMTEKSQKSQNLFECSCGKQYKYRQGLHKHQLKCTKTKTDETKKETDETKKETDETKKETEETKKETDETKKETDETKIEKTESIDYKDMFLKMMKQNNELMTQVTDLIPKVGNNNNNTIKQKFNVNIFLNEECKDAITMNEFIKKIEVSLGNLLTTRDKGISEGVSDIFIENMNKLSIHERPMHCTDVKREIVYIKSDEDGNNSSWKIDKKQKRLKEALQKVSKVQQQNIKKWTDKNPNWENDTKLQKEYMKLIKNSTDDLKENKREEKVIKKLCNNSYLNEQD